jgi:hypothetical protein
MNYRPGVFGKTGGAIRCQPINPHTAGENRPIVCKDIVGKEVNRVSVEEASVFGSEMPPSAVYPKGRGRSFWQFLER